MRDRSRGSRIARVSLAQTSRPPGVAAGLRRSPPKLLTELRGLGKRARRDDRIATIRHPVSLRLGGREELAGWPVAVVGVGGQGNRRLPWRLSPPKEQRVLRDRSIGGGGGYSDCE